MIAASLIEAKALAHEGNFGREYADVVRHTRELYDELLEELVIAGPSGSEFARGLADSIGIRLDDLELAYIHRGDSAPKPKASPKGIASP